ncbi:methyl-accepting chemotaxis protein [Thauera sp. AutoDN2]|uniref:methyl-accepting chemotaxis protein n=1 Tax=Thauera sp. AutoDN2 TaxID=3416051 RepID=UPI003F4BE8B9
MALNLFTKKNAAPGSTEESTILETGAPRRTPASDTKPVPERSGSDLRGLGMMLAALVIATIGLLVYQGRTSSLNTLQVSASSELQTLSQQLARSAQMVRFGDAGSIAELNSTRARFASLLQTLDEGGTYGDAILPPVPETVRPQLEQLEAVWSKTSSATAQLANQADIFVAVAAAVQTINGESAALFDASEDMLRQAIADASDTGLLSAATALSMQAQRAAGHANTLLLAEEATPEAAAALGTAGDRMREQLEQLKRRAAGTRLTSAAQELEIVAGPTLTAINSIVAGTHPLLQAREAARGIASDAAPLLAGSAALTAALTRISSGFGPLHVGALLTAALSVFLLILMIRSYASDLAARRAATEVERQKAENERNLSQQAILRLMNEMGDLADGDLTMRATVSEDITGAIADSVNYTIEELAVLVRRINDAASRVTNATESARNTSNELLDATERQSREIEEAGTTTERMAQSMTESSERALQSAAVARRSLDVARKGADAVANTIRGMNDIRTQIQETAKRIKRLGESSQEIGEIVELISDITEQTNVLALNAAIQAASAGEAGRGFTVVAEEVQRLAERSAEATKQIAAIVKTIQTDTQDAVVAMENATQDVVEGAQLSDAAGQALAEIDAVSTDTARLIEQISADIQTQAATASRVAETMKDILAVTEQTSLGTRETAVSIEQLAELAVELKGSVSGFKV